MITAKEGSYSVTSSIIFRQPKTGPYANFRGFDSSLTWQRHQLEAFRLRYCTPCCFCNRKTIRPTSTQARHSLDRVCCSCSFVFEIFGMRSDEASESKAKPKAWNSLQLPARLIWATRSLHRVSRLPMSCPTDSRSKDFRINLQWPNFLAQQGVIDDLPYNLPRSQ